MASGSGGFFRMDGPFIRFGNLIFDILYINVLWLILSGIAPIIVFLYLTSNTILGNLPPIIVYPILIFMFIHWGPATSAVFYALGKRRRGTDSYITRDFWHAYKMDYKQSLIAALVLSLLIALIIYNIWILYLNYSIFGNSIYVVIPLECLVLLELVFTAMYLFPLLARFEMSIKDLFKYAFFMANKHLPWTLLCLVVMVALFLLMYYVSILVAFIAVGVYCYITVGIYERVFHNYMPDPDEGLEEEDYGDFNLSDERQAIINRYLGRSTEDEDSPAILIDEEGHEIPEESYKVVKVEKEEEKTDGNQAEGE